MNYNIDFLNSDKIILTALLPLVTFSSFSQEKSLEFLAKKIASESFESVGVFDVNGDAVLDLVSGSYWYEGPEFPPKKFYRAIR